MVVPSAKVVSRLPNRASAAPILAAASISLGALIILLQPRGSLGNLDLWFLGFLLVAIGVLPLLPQWLRGEYDLFSMRTAFLSLYLLTFSGWLFYLLLTDKYVFLGSVASVHDLLRNAMLMACLGLAVFQIAYSLRLGDHVALLLPVPRAQFSVGKVRVAVGFLLLIAAISCGSWVYSRGGLFYVITHLEQIHSTWERVGMAPFEKGISMASLAYLIWYAYLGSRRTVFAIPFLVMVMLLGLVTSSRVSSAVAFVSAVVLYHYRKQRLFSKPWHLLMVPLLLFVLLLASAVFGRYRVYTTTSPSPVSALERSVTAPDLVEESLVEGFLSRFFGVEAVARIMDFTPGSVPYCWGIPLLRFLATYLIPRALWPGKPEPYILIMNRTYWTWMPSGDYGGPCSTLVGEAYWTAGTFGVVFFCMLVGFFCKFADQYLKRARVPSVLVIYSFAFVYVILINEAFVNYVVDFMSALLPLLVVLWFIHSGPARARSTSRLAHESSGQDSWSQALASQVGVPHGPPRL